MFRRLGSVTASPTLLWSFCFGIFLAPVETIVRAPPPPCSPVALVYLERRSHIRRLVEIIICQSHSLSRTFQLCVCLNYVILLISHVETFGSLRPVPCLPSQSIHHAAYDFPRNCYKGWLHAKNCDSNCVEMGISHHYGQGEY